MKNKLFLSLICAVLVLGLATGCGKNDLSTKNEQVKGNNNGDISASVEVNGTKLQFPCKIQDLKDAGFVFNLSDDEIDKQLKDGVYVLTGINNMMLTGNGVFIIGEDFNNSQVIGISLEKTPIETEKYTINGLEIGKATLQEVIDVFGQPTEPKEYNYNDYTLFLNFGDYDNKSFRGYELKMTFRAGVLIEFDYIEKNRL